MRFSGVAPQFKTTKGPSLRWLLRCTSRAVSSWPVPGSPVKSEETWAGATFFAWMERRYKQRDPNSLGHGLWVESVEPIAAGIVAGAAIMGIGDQLISVFVLGG